MEELVRTNDIVLISYIQSLLDDAGVMHMVLDGHMSVLEGSMGLIQRRILVDSDQVVLARMRLTEAGLDKELRDR
jgi:Putative prokaryotic signal transducing protein